MTTLPIPKEIKSATSSLAHLIRVSDCFGTLAKTEFDGVTSAKIIRWTRFIAPHYERFTKARHDAFVKLGAEKGPNDTLTISTEKAVQLNEILEPMLKEQIEFDPAMKIDIGAMSSVKISPADLITLEPILSGL